MKKTYLLQVMGLLLLFATLLTSCKEDTVIEPPPPPAGDLTVDTVKNLDADVSLSGKKTFYSIRTKSVIVGADTATNKWDVAFRGTTVWINGGALHNNVGTGGAIVSANTNFDTCQTAPTTGYAVDTSATSLAIRTGANNGWYSYDAACNKISAIPGVVIYLKTGDGKYAKMEIMNYYENSDPQPPCGPTNFRYYTFRFVYQPDGTTDIK